MKWFNWILVLIATGLVAVLTVLLLKQQDRVSVAQVLFLGITNTFNGNTGSTGKFAVILFTNTIPYEIRERPKSIEFMTETGWVSNVFTTNWADADYHFPKDWGLEKLRGDDGVYGSHAELFFVPFPASNVAWRVSFECQEQNEKDRRMHLLRRLFGEHSWTYSGREYEVSSPVIE